MMKNYKIDRLIKKYNLKNKTQKQIQEMIGNSEKGCFSPNEVAMLSGETFIDKGQNLFDYVQIHNFN